MLFSGKRLNRIAFLFRRCESTIQAKVYYFQFPLETLLSSGVYEQSGNKKLVIGEQGSREI